ncbi:DUF2110 family protein [Natrialbaceae archaeon A-CW3]
MVVLATKLYVEGEARERSLDSLRSLVNNDIGDLEVEFDLGIRHDDFPSVTIEGEDAVVARNVLREEWGEIVPDLEAGETYVGTLERWDEDGFVLDAGTAVRIPADQLGLGPGTPAQIRERFGLVQHLPMEFVYGGAGDASGTNSADGAGDGTDPEEDTTPSRLSDAERDRLFEWTRGDGRLNVNSATRAEVRATLNRAGHAQDYVTIERLGLLEQSVICTDDTDPPGLLSSIGSYLPAELRCVVP